MHISFPPQRQHNFVPEDIFFSFIPFGKRLFCREASWLRRGAPLSSRLFPPPDCFLCLFGGHKHLRGLSFHLKYGFENPGEKQGRLLRPYLIGDVHHQIVFTLVSVAVLGRRGKDGCFISCPRPLCCIQTTLITREKTNTDQYINISGCSLLPSTGCLPSNIWQRDTPDHIFCMNVS